MILPTNLDLHALRRVHEGVFLQADLDHLAHHRVQHEIRPPVHHLLHHVQDLLVPFLLAASGTAVHLEDERVLKSFGLSLIIVLFVSFQLCSSTDKRLESEAPSHTAASRKTASRALPASLRPHHFAVPLDPHAPLPACILGASGSSCSRSHHLATQRRDSPECKRARSCSQRCPGRCPPRQDPPETVLPQHSSATFVPLPWHNRPRKRRCSLRSQDST